MNIIQTYINPYLNIIKWIGGVLLASALFIGGCSWGENRAEVDNTELTAEVVALRLANASYASAVEEAEKQQAANRRFAEEQMKAAEEASERVAAMQREQLRKEAQWKQEFARAMADPKCADLMKLEVCNVAPMP